MAGPSSATSTAAAPAAAQVLGWALALLAALWLGYTAWSAGRALADQPLTSPAFAQWVAIAAGPLALLGLVWLMFGRTRRKEAEKFTRSVIAMRTEARALEDVLAALSRQIDHNHGALGQMAGSLMGLGDEAATRLGAVTADLERELAAIGRAWRLARPRGRSRRARDLGVMLADLPLAEQQALRMAEALRGAGQHSIEQAGRLPSRGPGAHRAHARQADATIARRRLAAASQHLTNVESAGAAAATRASRKPATSPTPGIDALLVRAAEALTEIRTGIDAQAATVTALLDQAPGRASAAPGSRPARRSRSASTAPARRSTR